MRPPEATIGSPTEVGAVEAPVCEGSDAGSSVHLRRANVACVEKMVDARGKIGAT